MCLLTTAYIKRHGTFLAELSFIHIHKDPSGSPVYEVVNAVGADPFPTVLHVPRTHMHSVLIVHCKSAVLGQYTVQEVHLGCCTVWCVLYCSDTLLYYSLGMHLYL